MGYACPVCGTPQADARHLANHLAFTAMLHSDDHEVWLNEHVPNWQEDGEYALANRVREFADDADYPQVFEDTTGRMKLEHDHEGDAPGERSGALFSEEGLDERAARGGADAGTANLDEETQEVLEEARDLTRRMLKDDDEDEDGSDG